MEKGQMRVEANVSLASSKEKLGTKVEIKNLNSFKAVEEAIEYEIERQKKVLESGKKITQETRGWDPNKKITFSQREKEKAEDYRYFPEPDLPPLEITSEMIDEIQSTIPELPQKKRERLKIEYGLEESAIEIFVKNKNLGEYFEKVVSEFEPNLSKEKLSRLIKLATNYLITDLLGILKEASIEGEDFKITPENFAEFITLIEEGKISSKIAKMILEEMFKTGADPSHIIEEKKLVLISERSEIEKIAQQIVLENEKAVSDFKSGKTNAIQFLIGQMMKKTKGKVNPQLAKDILKKVIENY
jgi:aspartyl-tRNA(Asn)/glutamyl-tRNA(Gln) amidotransferase subunit B